MTRHRSRPPFDVPARRVDPLDPVAADVAHAVITVGMTQVLLKEIARPGSQALHRWGPQITGDRGVDLLLIASYLDLTARHVTTARMHLTWALRGHYGPRTPEPDQPDQPADRPEERPAAVGKVGEQP